MHHFKASFKYFYLQPRRDVLGLGEKSMAKLAAIVGLRLVAKYPERVDGEESQSNLQ